MKRWNFCMRFVMMVGVVHLCLASVGYTAGNQGQAGPHGQSMDAATQAMMAKWQAYASPNDNHNVLNPLVGTWSHVVKWWMTPDSQPETSKGTSETKWVMGGRYLRHEAKVSRINFLHGSATPRLRMSGPGVGTRAGVE